MLSSSKCTLFLNVQPTGVLYYTDYTYLLGQAITVMSSQSDLDAIVNIEPFRMMIHLQCCSKGSCYSSRTGYHVS
jgi:hypothetical protein